MRLQEIFNLTWQDIDFDNRRIEIRKSKTDHLSAYEGRTIVLTIGADAFQNSLMKFNSEEEMNKHAEKLRKTYSQPGAFPNHFRREKRRINRR